MQEEQCKSLVDYATTDFEKSLKELRNFSSQLYDAADYCETAFLNARNKKRQAYWDDGNIIQYYHFIYNLTPTYSMVKNTKEYVSQAVVTFVDHLGSISASLECCISESNSVLETEYKIDALKVRIMTWQEYPHKIALHRFYCASTFPRYHCRYIPPPLTNSSMMSPGVSRIDEVGIEARTNKGKKFQTEEPLFLYTNKPSSAAISTRNTKKDNGSANSVLPAHDRLSILPKADLSNFMFQEAQKLKRSNLNWKLMQNKEITSLIRRGKRILT